MQAASYDVMYRDFDVYKVQAKQMVTGVRILKPSRFTGFRIRVKRKSIVQDTYKYFLFSSIMAGGHFVAL